MSTDILAVETTPWAVRLALCDEENHLINYLETKPQNLSRISGWLRGLDDETSVTVLANPLDPWFRSLEELFNGKHQLTWLSPLMAREAREASSYWDSLRRLHRCRLLAYLGRNPGGVHVPPDTNALVTAWEYRAACETSDLVRRQQ